MSEFFSFAHWQRATRPLAVLGLLLAAAGATQAQTTTYAYTGGNQTYTVPAGITSIRVVATGASGAVLSSGGTPTYGGQVQATILVTPGEQLTVVVGGQGIRGAVTGAFNGGGISRSESGGGGATDLRRNGASTGDYLTTRNALVVAGGSGGGYYGPGMGIGGNGGAPNGGNGESYNVANSGGGGATQTGPGSAGNGGNATPGNNGTGGSASTITATGGSGGGGGYYGGGGSGATMAGGGGGSSWVTPTGSSSVSYSLAPATGNGLLTITPAALADLTVSTSTTIPAGSYNNITITGTGTGTLAGNVTVAGALVVQSGGTLNDGCATVSGAGSFTLAAGATLGICAAQGISSSGASGSIQNTGSRSFSPDASYVYNGTTTQITGSGLPGTVRNLTTTNSNSVTLSQAAIVNRIVTVGGTGNLVLNGNALTLPSSASGTALVVNSSTGVVQGATGTMQRYIDASGNTGTSGYRHYSSPVSGATVGSFSTSAYGGSFIAQVNLLYNTQDPTTLPAAAYPNVFFFDESKFYLSPAVTFSDFDKRYQSPQSLSDALVVGRGYAVQIGNQEKVQFTGTFNSGTQTIGNLFYTQLSSGSNTGTSAGWHLIGNPYPSPLDWGTVGASGTGSSLSTGLSSIYVFQSTSAYSGRYTSFVNNVGAGSNLIAAGQAFFVRNPFPTSTPGSITLTNANRITTYGATPAFQRQAETRPLLRLSLGLGNQPATTATAQDETFVYFEQGATSGVDGRYDAYKLANPSGYYLSTASADVQPTDLSIDGRAPLATGTSLVVPVGLSVPAGSYTLTATSLLNFAGMQNATVTLRDALTGTLTNLTSTSSYSFTVAVGAASSGRFSLLFGPQTALATTAAATPVASLYPNPSQGNLAELTVSGLGTEARSVEATVLNALGQVVSHSTVAATQGSARANLPTQRLASGVYLVRLLVRNAQGQLIDTLPTQRLSVR